MDRLQFLKAFGLTLGGGVLAKRALLADTLSGTPAPRRFKPGPEGSILVSRGGREAWTVHKAFGPSYEVLAVRQEGDGTYADLRFLGKGVFRLRLDASGQEWLVA